MNANFKINGKTIETDRLILRPFEPQDLNDFYDYAKVPGVGEMAGWIHHENIEETKRILDSFIENDKTFAICLKETDKVIGSLGIEEYSLEKELTEFESYLGRELGFVLSKEYWNKGYMSEACKAVIDYLFNELKYDFLICGHFEKNVQSRRVQEKLGFKPYRKMVFDTRMNTKEPGILNLLINPSKDLRFDFSHKETLIWNV